MKKKIKKGSIAQRLSFNISLLLAFLMISVGFISYNANQISLKKETIDKGWFLTESSKATIAAFLSSDNPAMVQNLIYKMKSAGKDIDYISVIKEDGSILAHTDVIQIGKIVSIKEKPSGDRTLRTYRDKSGKQTGYEFTSPVTNDTGNRIGYLQVGITTSGKNSILSALLISLALTAFAALAAGILLSKIITGKLLVRPLKELKDATEYISSGDFTRQVTVYKMDELGVLGTSFNSMTSRLANLFMSVRSSVAELNKNSELIIKKSWVLEFKDNDNPDQNGIFSLNDKQLEALEEINKSAKKIHRMVERLNNLSFQFKV